MCKLISKGANGAPGDLQFTARTFLYLGWDA